MSELAQYNATLRALWKGFIMLEVEIAESDVSSKEMPDKAFVSASRYSYFPVALSDIVEHFRDCAVEFSSDVWFECDGHPLQCNIPIGALYDVYGEQSRSMRIVVHFQAFPTQKILNCTNAIDCEHFYFHSLKQATFLLHGHTRLFNDLSVPQQQALWKAVCDTDQIIYESTAASLFPAAPAYCLTSDSTDSHSRHAHRDIKSIPVRVLRRDKPTLQRPVSLVNIPPPSVDIAHSSAADGSPLPVKTLLDVLLQDFGTALGLPVECSSLEIRIHGISVPPEAPIYDTWRLMCHCDLVLYIVLPMLSHA